MRTYFDHENLDVYQLELRFLESATAKGICTSEKVGDGKQLLLRIPSMLTKLISLFDSSSSSSSVIREEPPTGESAHEEEDEHENESNTSDS